MELRADGFGPVVDSAAEVLDELERLVDRGMTPGEPYATRMAQAFAFRDGRWCERVVRVDPVDATPVRPRHRQAGGARLTGMSEQLRRIDNVVPP